MNANHQPDDARQARWTAYALDQLDSAERRVVEAEVAASQQARQYVAEVRALSRQVRAAARQEAEAVEPSKALREAVEKRLSQKEIAAMETKPQTHGEADASPVVKTRWTRRHWIAAAAAACLLVAAVPLYLVLSAAHHNWRDVAMSGPGEVKEVQSPYSNAPRFRGEAALRDRNERLDETYAREYDMAADASDPSDMYKMAEETTEGLKEERGKFNEDRTGFAAGFLPSPQSGRAPQGAGDTPAPASEPSDPKLHASMPGSTASTGLGTQPGPQPGGEPTTRTQPDNSESHLRMMVKPRVVADDQTGGEVDEANEVLGIASGGQSGNVTGGGTRGRPGTKPGVYGPGSSEGEARYSPSRAPGTEQYDRIVENRFLPVAEKPQSTFSIDVDTASYANVRRFLTHGTWPPPDAVRIEEMVNYFKYDYPLPQGEAPFSVDMEVAQCPWNPGHRLLRVGLKGEEIDRKQRGLSNLVFLLDVSGSMASPDKLALVKQAMQLLVEQLDENDRVAIVTYAGTTGLHLESTNGENRDRILASIESLSAGGSTNGGAGIQLAYQQAVRYFIKGGTNRVILCTDGDLNVGITRDDDLVKLIKQSAKSGVFLTVMGFGTGNLKDAKLEKLADHGNGIYAYIDSLREAQKVLVEQLTGSLITIAKDVKLQIEFNPAEVASYRLVGYENRVMAAKDFHDDKKDAGEIGAGHTVTALYELVPAGGNQADEPAEDKPPAQPAGKLKYQRGPAVRLTEAAETGELLTLSLRYKQPDAERSKLLQFTAKDSDKRIGEASQDFQFASAVAAFGMILRNSGHRGQATLSAVEEIAASAVGDDPGGHRAELIDLVRRAKQLRR